MSDDTVKYVLPESEIPMHWVNLLPDLPGDPMPPLNPGTMQPAGPEDLTPIFPMGLIQQEVSMDPQVEIPDEVRDVYRRWRPSPLDGASGARNKNSHDMILIFVATARQVVGANVKSSVRMWRRKLCGLRNSDQARADGSPGGR